MSEISIVIPVYNESENISILISKIEEEINFPHQTIIVYDFDEDNTISIVKKIQNNYKSPIKLVKNIYGKGALNAIKTGFKTANSSYIAVVMADLSDPPSVINEMMKIAREKNPDIVCASRYMKNGKQIGGPLLKGLLSRLAGLSLYYFAGVGTHDATNNFKLYKKSFLDTIEIESIEGFEVGLELVVKAHIQQKKVCEVPTTWHCRTMGNSKFKLIKWLPSYLKWYFKAFGR